MKTIKVSSGDIDSAADKGLITPSAAKQLWSFLESRDASAQSEPAEEDDGPTSSLSSLSWYSGATIVLLAMSWLVGQLWSTWNGGGVALIASLYAVGFAIAGKRLWKVPATKTPGGLFYTLSAAMAPLVVLALERMGGLWSGDIHWVHEVSLESSLWLALALSSVLALRFVRFHFLVAPLTLSLMSLAAEGYRLFHEHGTDNQETYYYLGIGLVAVAAAFVVDRRSKRDFATWPYLFGAVTAWSAFTWLYGFNSSESQLAVYGIINVGLMLVSVLLSRSIFVMLGSIGAVSYLSHLAWTVFAGSLLFPLVVSIFGVGVILSGVYYSRNKARIDAAIVGFVPQGLRKFLPDRN